MFLDCHPISKAIGFTYKYCFTSFREIHSELYDEMITETMPIELEYIKKCRQVLRDNKFDLSEFNKKETSNRKEVLKETKRGSDDESSKRVVEPECIKEMHFMKELELLRERNVVLNEENNRIVSENICLKHQLAKQKEIHETDLKRVKELQASNESYKNKLEECYSNMAKNHSEYERVNNCLLSTQKEADMMKTLYLGYVNIISKSTIETKNSFENSKKRKQ